MLKGDYKYYLRDGQCVEYSLSPDTNLLALLDTLVNVYYVKDILCKFPNRILVSPSIFMALNKEIGIFQGMRSSLSNNAGLQVLTLHTMIGPFEIIAVPDIEYPIFIGSDKDYEDNSFTLLMNKVLKEE